MVDLSVVLILFSPLNDLSAEQEVTGNVQRISNRTLMFGKRDDAWGKVNDGVFGRETCPFSCSCSFHFKYQL